MKGLTSEVHWKAESWEPSWAVLQADLWEEYPVVSAHECKERTFGQVQKTISNRDLIQQAADMAYKEIPGEGPVVGTKRHEFATKYLEEYQAIHGDRGLEFKVYFRNRLTMSVELSMC